MILPTVVTVAGISVLIVIAKIATVMTVMRLNYDDGDDDDDDDGHAVVMLLNIRLATFQACLERFRSPALLACRSGFFGAAIFFKVSMP